MDKSAAIAELNRRGATPLLTSQNTRFANVNVSKAVWWLDLPLDYVFNHTEGAVNLVLAGSRNGELFHLRVPKVWLTENIEEFAVRNDKSVISLELSCDRQNRFQDVRPTSRGLHFGQFRVTEI
jgi:hypothetical protein